MEKTIKIIKGKKFTDIQAYGDLTKYLNFLRTPQTLALIEFSGRLNL